MAAEPATGAPGQGAPDGLPTPRRYYAAATVLTGMSLSVLDATIANVALPTIAADLNAPPSAAVWVINAYNLAVVTMLLPMSAVAERVGFRRMFSIGLVLFMLASLACAFATSLEQLSLARMVQGVGAATLMCMFGGLVRNIYPTHMLGRGISINATTVALMSVLGPTLGSLILSVAHWRWIFAVNLPVGLLLLLGLRFPPEVPRNRLPMDYPSALLSMVALGCVISGVDSFGSDVLRGLGLLAVGGVAGLLLVRRSWAQPAPLVPVDLLRIRPLAFAVMASASTFSAQMAAYVTLPFYFHEVLGRPHLEVGLLMAAWPLGTGLIAPAAGFLSDRYSAAVLSAVGAAAMMAGLLWLVLSPADASNARIMAGMLVAGLGFGFFQTPNNRVLLSSAPRHRSGAIGGLQATTRVFGQSFGTALVAIAFGMSLNHGPTLGLVAAALCAGLAIAVNSVRIAKRVGQPVA